MKHVFFFSILLLFAACTGCDDTDDDPCEDCPSFATCLDGECVLPPNTFKLGEHYIRGYNTYVGILQSDVCPAIDSMLFDVQPNDVFTLYVNYPPVQDIGVGTIQKLSDSTYSLFTIKPICYYAYVHATINTDSVNLDFKFWDLEQPDVILDSAKVTLYKQWP
jgi:hypothetical protein